MRRIPRAIGVVAAASIACAGISAAAGVDAASPGSPIGPACEEMEAVVSASPMRTGAADWPALASGGSAADGEIVAIGFGPDERANLMHIPLDGGPLDRITAWPLGSLSIAGATARPDGGALALPFYFGNGCADVLVLSRDGQAAWRPFRDSTREAVLNATWSPDGDLLAAQGLFGVDDAGRLVSVPGSVWAWEPASDTVRDLGRPCAGCWLGESGLFWSPDGTRLAAPYTGDRCPRFLHTPDDPTGFDPEATFEPPCWAPGIAVVDRSGTWQRVVPRPDLTAGGFINLDGWLDEHTVLLDDGSGAGVRLDVDTGASVPITFPVGAPRLSPDRRRAAMVDNESGAWSLVLMELATGTVTRVDVPAEPSFVWAPDSASLAVLVSEADGGRRRIEVVPANGSTPPRMVRQGPFSPLAWLPG